MKPGKSPVAPSTRSPEEERFSLSPSPRSNNNKSCTNPDAGRPTDKIAPGIFFSSSAAVLIEIENLVTLLLFSLAPHRLDNALALLRAPGHPIKHRAILGRSHFEPGMKSEMARTKCAKWIW
jgi:hypothetical protein